MRIKKDFISQKFLNSPLLVLVYNDHPWDPKIVAVVDKWSLLRGHLCSKSPILDHKMVVVVDRWSLFGGGGTLIYHSFLTTFV